MHLSNARLHFSLSESLETRGLVQVKNSVKSIIRHSVTSNGFLKEFSEEYLTWSMAPISSVKRSSTRWSVTTDTPNEREVH